MGCNPAEGRLLRTTDRPAVGNEGRAARQSSGSELYVGGNCSECEVHYTGDVQATKSGIKPILDHSLPGQAFATFSRQSQMPKPLSFNVRVRYAGVDDGWKRESPANYGFARLWDRPEQELNLPLLLLPGIQSGDGREQGPRTNVWPAAGKTLCDLPGGRVGRLGDIDL